MRVVLDTNVLIASVLKNGLASEIIDLAKVRHLDLIISDEILVELVEKISSKFSWNEEETGLLLKNLRRISEVIQSTPKLNAVPTDPDDNKILEAAIAGNAGLVVSIDQDLLKLKTYQGIAIVHPKTLTWILPKLFEKNS
jgi:putative PIN family toxin of toxin-antitoxin system